MITFDTNLVTFDGNDWTMDGWQLVPGAAISTLEEQSDIVAALDVSSILFAVGQLEAI